MTTSLGYYIWKQSSFSCDRYLIIAVVSVPYSRPHITQYDTHELLNSVSFYSNTVYSVTPIVGHSWPSVYIHAVAQGNDSCLKATFIYLLQKSEAKPSIWKWVKSNIFFYKRFSSVYLCIFLKKQNKHQITKSTIRWHNNINISHYNTILNSSKSRSSIYNHRKTCDDTSCFSYKCDVNCRSNDWLNSCNPRWSGRQAAWSRKYVCIELHCVCKTAKCGV